MSKYFNNSYQKFGNYSGTEHSLKEMSVEVRIKLEYSGSMEIRVPEFRVMTRSSRQ